jgi:replication factor C subunit 3/5
MSELPWIEKYRPKTFNDVIDHKDKIKTLENLIKENQLTHLLFYGPPGTGKTSLILALAREMYGENFRKYILEINASSDRGIDTIRVSVVQFITMRSDKVKLVLLDEADALTTEAQGALKSIMEKYSNYCRFCLICNDVNKISPALQSRCVKMVFSHLNAELTKIRLKDIIEKENILIDETGIDAMIELEKDFRQLINILQGIHYSSAKETITQEHVSRYMGKPSAETIKLLLVTLFESTFNEGCRVITDMYKSCEITPTEMINAITKKIISVKLDISKKHYIFELLSRIDNFIHNGCDMELQIAYLVSGFLYIRTAIE